MSLDDKFNPHDGSLIDIFDTAMIDAHKKIANVWQDKTHLSKDVLRENLYLGSMAALGISGYRTDSYMTGIMATTLAVLGTKGLPTNSKQEEIKSEIVGLPKKFFKYTYALGFCSGWGFIGVGVYLANSDYSKFDLSTYEASKTLVIEGIAMLLYVSSAYLGKANVGPPPKKPKKKKLTETIDETLESLVPQAMPEGN